jgi:tRNA G18 (ribose-2'-O)-methylase SpoU
LICHVSRADDPRLQHYRHVGEPAWLEQHGLFVAEGRLVVERLLSLSGGEPSSSGGGKENGGYVVESVLVTPAALRALEPGIDPSWLVLVAEPAIVESVTGVKFHRGCLALVRRPTQSLPLSAFAEARRLVLLEAVANPDNIGGIFRSATALGGDAVLLDSDCGDPFYRKAVRTSMGAVLRLPFTRVDPWLPGLATLRDMGFSIVALSPTGELTLEAFLATLSADARLALVAGAEGYGLSTATIAAADVTMRIPVDPQSDSLNIVVAVSIALSRLGSALRPLSN